MTLFRQISLLTIMLMAVLLAGNLVVSVLNTRFYLEKQLHIHAQDTATSLGLSVSQFIHHADIAKVAAMVDAIFDRGYFQSIVIVDKSGEVILERYLPLKMEGVPQWFQHLIDLQVPEGDSILMEGWRPQGRVKIQSHPGYAYRDLWRNAKQAFLWYCIIGLATLGVLLSLIRSTLKPLKAVELQAAAICEKDFSFQLPLPRTRELRRVVQAMNRMTHQLKLVFDEQIAVVEQVREQTYKDLVTGIGNELFFKARFGARMDTPEESSAGALVLLKLTEFWRYNDNHGRAAGDLLLKQIAGRWKKTLEAVTGSVIARRAGVEFIAWLPNVTQEEAEFYLHAVYGAVTSLSTLIPSDEGNLFHIGMAHSDVDANESMLFDTVEAAVRNSQATGCSSAHLLKVGSDKGLLPLQVRNLSNEQWRTLLQSALDQEEVILHFQPVVSCIEQTVLHFEVLMRLNVQGATIQAGFFMPMVERLGFAEAFDRYVIEEILLLASREDALRKTSYCVNLSARSIQADGFVEWLLSTLKVYYRVASCIVIEIPEYTLATISDKVPVDKVQVDKVRSMVMGLRQCGVRVSIDHFGAANRSMSYFSSLPINAIKVDHSFIRDIESNNDHQLFVQSLLRIARSRNVIVLAESVELEAQWDLLKKMGVDGAQGHFLATPGTLDSVSKFNNQKSNAIISLTKKEKL